MAKSIEDLIQGMIDHFDAQAVVVATRAEALVLFLELEWAKRLLDVTAECLAEQYGVDLRSVRRDLLRDTGQMAP